ncbi:MAG: tyrosine--tRNA ligase [Myxococcota bacterium]
MNAIDILKARGFFNQCTDEDALRKLMDEGPVTFYVGFDPTADSLHVGHLVQVMAMANLHRAGHKAIPVVGGGTVQVGDPSFKDETRELLTPERMEANKAKIGAQLAKFAPGTLVDNADWLMKLNYVEFIRDIGRHFSVNVMVKAESMKQRLERGQGLSFLEFNYPLLQSYDFLELYRRYGCRLQVGGGDQWFNIISGADLIRRVEGGSAFGLTTPLLTTASGAKMGKTVAGAVWLDAEKVSPFDYNQYWYNCDDRDVEKFLKLFTFLPIEQIEEAVKGDIRAAKRLLADEATAIVHGRDVLVPKHVTTLPKKLVDLLVETGLVPSKSEARRKLNDGVRFGGEKLHDPDFVVASPGTLQLGKKKVELCLP